MKHLIFYIIIITFLQGCSATKMYDGPALKGSQASLLYVKWPGTRYIKIDGNEVDYGIGTSALEFQPGVRSFSVEIFNESPGSDMFVERINIPSYNIRTFDINFEMQAGYSYQIQWPPFTSDLPNILCVIGEPHDAPGGSTNITGEFRQFGKAAEKYGCSNTYVERMSW